MTKQELNDYMVNKWLTDPNFEAFRRQAHTDASVGLKNGVPKAEVKAVAEAFAQKFVDSFNWDNKVPWRK